MTASDQPKAPATQRVSDERLAEYIHYCRFEHENHLQISGQTALDLRDARARIAELEADLHLLRDAVARVASWDWTEKCCDEAAYAHHSMVRLAQCHEREDELIGFEEELAAANARADRLATELAEAKAAGREEGLPEQPTREIWAVMADAFIKAHHDHGRRTVISPDFVTGPIYSAIRARLSAAEPTT